MFRNIRNMFRSNAKPIQKPRRSSLRMETLEGRELMAAGAFDTSFADTGRADVPTGIAADSAPVVERLSSGRILVGTSVRFSNGDTDFSITKFQGNGNVDTTFGTNGTTRVAFDRGGMNRDTLADIAVDSAGRIVLVGSVEFAGNDIDYGVARLLSNGRLDGSFGTGGKTTVHFDIGGDRTDVPTAVQIDSANRVVVAGSVRVTSTTRDVGVIRLNTAGRVDTSFGNGGRTLVPINQTGVADDFAGGAAIDSRGRIVIAASAQFRASSTDYDFAAIRLTPSGRPDQSFSGDGIAIAAFDLGGGLTDTARDVAIGLNDSVVLAGTVTRGGSDTDFAIARFTSAGGLDRNFDGDGRLVIPINQSSQSDDFVTAVDIDRLGRIVIFGGARLGSATIPVVVRISTNGFRDTSFGNNGIAIASLNDGPTISQTPGGMDLDPNNGNILIAGLGRLNTAVVGRLTGS